MNLKNKLLLIVFFSAVAIILGCLPKTQKKSIPCFSSSRELYDYFVKEVNTGSMINSSMQFADSLTAENLNLKYFLGVNRPKVSFIPKAPDGAYGIIKKEKYDLYYSKFKQNGEPDSIRVIVVGKKDSCYRILTITPVKPTDE